MTQVILVLFAGSVSFIVGAWVYWKIRGTRVPNLSLEIRARIMAGLATALVSAAVFVVLGVHKFLGDETPWTASVFLGICLGLLEGILYRGQLLEHRHPTVKEDSANDE